MRLTRLREILFRRPRYRITRGGSLYLLTMALTGAGAFLAGNNLLFLLFAAMMALLMVSGFISRLSLAGLELELLLPEHVSARAQTRARIRIRNLKRFSASWSIELSGRAGAGSPPILMAPLYFPYVGGRSTAEVAVSVVFPRRGRHQENLFLLSTSFPFGFVRRAASVALHHETVVYPALEPHEEMDLLLEEMTSTAQAMSRGTGNDFLRIRPWQTGDDARHTDWKSTARTGSIHVREFSRDERRPVELWFDRHIEPGQEREFEEMIERCAFLVWELARRKLDMIFRTEATTLALSGGVGVYDILKVLSLMEPCLKGNRQSPGNPADEAGLQVVFSAQSRRSE